PPPAPASQFTRQQEEPRAGAGSHTNGDELSDGRRWRDDRAECRSARQQSGRQATSLQPAGPQPAGYGARGTRENPPAVGEKVGGSDSRQEIARAAAKSADPQA